MTDSVPPPSSSPSQPPEEGQQVDGTPTYKEQTQDTDSGDHIVMGMHMNDDEWKQFNQNLMKSFSDQISQDQQDYERTQDQIKEMEQEDEGG